MLVLTVSQTQGELICVANNNTSRTLTKLYINTCCTRECHYFITYYINFSVNTLLKITTLMNASDLFSN